MTTQEDFELLDKEKIQIEQEFEVLDEDSADGYTPPVLATNDQIKAMFADVDISFRKARITYSAEWIRNMLDLLTNSAILGGEIGKILSYDPKLVPDMRKIIKEYEADTHTTVDYLIYKDDGKFDIDFEPLFIEKRKESGSTKVELSC